MRLEFGVAPPLGTGESPRPLPDSWPPTDLFAFVFIAAASNLFPRLQPSGKLTRCL